MTSSKVQQQFAAMVRECDPMLHRVCHLYGGRQCDDLEDVYQEIVLNLWQKFSSFRAECSFATWAYAVARNTAVEYYRRHSVRQPQIELRPAEAEEEHDPMVDELYHLLDQLNADDRALVGLYLDGYSYEEMAEMSHCSQMALRAKMSRIKKRLRKILNAQRKESVA